LVADESIVLFVVGLPLHLDGQESQKSQEARQFGKWLGETTGVPVEFFDERFTSREAEDLLLAADMTRKRRKKRMDMLAAQIMLSAYLESQVHGHEPDDAQPFLQ
jgi:putative Holliday junction resolvase